MVRRVVAQRVRGKLGQILEEVCSQGDTYVIERAGGRVAVLLPLKEYERLQMRRVSRFRIYEQIKARTQSIPPTKLAKVISEAVKEARKSR